MWACIISDHEPTSAKIQGVLTDEGPEAAQIVPFRLATDELTVMHPKLVVVVLGTDPDRGLTTIAEVRHLTQSHIVAVGPDGNSKLVLRAMHQGANDYVNDNDIVNELKEALARLEIKILAQGSPGKIIGVLAPSGGSGSSTLAVNIATLLAKEHERIVLFDLKLAAGDLAPLMDLKPKHNLAELCQNAGRIDRVMFERCLVQHASGVRLLSPPPTHADAAYVTAQGVRQALTLARALFPYVVIDLDHSYSEEQEQALRLLDELVLVLRLDFTSLRNVRTTLDYLGQIGVSRDRIRLVVNRFGQPKELAPAKAEEALGLKVFHYVPDEPKTVNRANNNGTPVVLEAPSAYVSRSLVELAKNLNGRAK